MTSGLAAFLLDHPGADDDPIVHWIDGALTLGELRSRAEAAAKELAGRGVAPGDAVPHVVRSGAEALAAMFGTWLAGCIYIPVNGRLTESEIDAQLGAAAPDTPSGTALIMRTSGTTGQAKPIILSHEGVAKGIDASLGALRTKPGRPDRPDQPDQPKRAPMPNLVPTSQALWAGIWNTLFALRAGAPVVLMDRFDAVEFATLIRRHQIRSTVLAPAMMSMLTEDSRVAELAPLTMVRNITAPLTPYQARAFGAKFGIGIMNCYGQTELGGEVVGWNAADLREHGDAKLGAVGRPHRGVEVHIQDPDGTPRGTDEIGEVWIHSPFMSTDPDIVAQTVDGFLRTGDLGRVDADGFLWLEGRAGDVINRGGLKVMPQEVEDALRALPGVADAGVAGVPDERLGDVPVAWIRVAAGATVDEASLLSALRENLAGYKVPVAVRMVDELPRNDIGKLLRRSLVQQWEDEQ